MTVVRAFRVVLGSTIVGALLVTAGIFGGIVGGVTSSAIAPQAAGAQCYPAGSASCPGGLKTTSTTVPPGGTVTLTGSGFLANSTVTIDVCGVETFTTKANSKGQINVPITVPAGVTGTCKITATGLNAAHQSYTLSLTVKVKKHTHTHGTVPGSTVPGAHTGEPWAGWPYWLLAAGLGVLGFWFVAFGRRRWARQ